MWRQFRSDLVDRRPQRSITATGWPDKVVAQLMGHAQVDATLTVYSAAMPAQQHCRVMMNEGQRGRSRHPASGREEEPARLGQ